jgi:uncharacterized protein with PQ loop repeat
LGSESNGVTRISNSVEMRLIASTPRKQNLLFFRNRIFQFLNLFRFWCCVSNELYISGYLINIIDYYLRLCQELPTTMALIVKCFLNAEIKIQRIIPSKIDAIPVKKRNSQKQTHIRFSLQFQQQFFRTLILQKNR